MNKKYVIYDAARKRVVAEVEHVVHALRIIEALRIVEEDQYSYNVISVTVDTIMRFGGKNNERDDSIDNHGDLLNLWDSK